MKYAGIGPITVYLPDRIENNAMLQAQFPEWDMNLIGSKTGIDIRHIASEHECSSDLGYQAAEALLTEYQIDRSSIDFLLFCTQTPDYALPTTACLLQDRLGLRTDCGALDFNLGCSGFVYGMALADGLIRTGSARRILLITAETYTKLIHVSDRSLRTIFGDAGAATLIEAVDQPSIWGYQYGTDGSGANTLLAHGGGFRPVDDAIKPRHRKRWPSDLYMDGPSLMSFTVGKIPETVNRILEAADTSASQIKFYLFHQATAKLLEQLRIVLKVEDWKLPIRLENVGNTVSCTLPILLKQMRENGELNRFDRHLMVGFGVGWSWAGCVWQDVLGDSIPANRR